MADSKISDLSAVTDVIGTDEYVLARSGATNKITAADLLVADAVGFTPAGTISATDVQAAIEEVATEAGSAGLFSAYAYLRDQQAANTNGGTFTQGAWQTRVLNTEVFDTAGIVSLSSNQFTLQAGTYRIKARAPAFDCNAHKAKIYNVTDAADALIGSSEWADTTGNGFSASCIDNRVTIAGAKAFELRHQCLVTKATTGFGAASNMGVVEVYAEVWIWKEV